MTQRRLPNRQAGFSMVEMLMAAFILAIGLLGLAMLQTMSLRASRGGKSLHTAVQVAERVMDQIEMEGRLGWLNITDSNYSTPGTLSQLQFIGKGTTVYLGFDAAGVATTSAPVSSKPSAFFVAAASEGAAVTGSTGKYSDYTVTVTFADQTDASGSAITRTVTLTRRVLHG
ncbi:prepilin-type N-terminal cleavage/methylation domain-containing protein [Holophaga foetida]|uniref:prepilin-type N-terminal cleavage/methylation domain-containing protein n=1 Tax=Holophaga foetida TaxID=35839 RepID=UPI0002472F68|nr:prepilin-type N-terminal cleavage/methylation domain-containing protein [Holophaga foetida]